MIAWNAGLAQTNALQGHSHYHKKEDSMPRGDGTGPPGGSGPGRGRGMGRGGGAGAGRGAGRAGGTRAGAGLGGECVCPKCGTTVPHQAGVPCNQMNCPSCGTQMARK